MYQVFGIVFIKPVHYPIPNEQQEKSIDQVYTDGDPFEPGFGLSGESITAKTGGQQIERYPNPGIRIV